MTFISIDGNGLFIIGDLITKTMMRLSLRFNIVDNVPLEVLVTYRRWKLLKILSPAKKYEQNKWNIFYHQTKPYIANSSDEKILQKLFQHKTEIFF